MVSQCLFLFNVVLITRIFLYFTDHRVRSWKILLVCLIQEAATFVFQPNDALVGLRKILLVLNVAAWVIEKVGRDQTITTKRLFTLFLYSICFGFYFAPVNRIEFSPVLGKLVFTYGDLYLAAKKTIQMDWHKLQYWLFGSLLCINEANLLVRFTIEKLMLRPIGDSGTTKRGASDRPPVVESEPKPASPAPDVTARVDNASTDDLNNASRKAGTEINIPANLADAQKGAEQKEYSRGRIIGCLERVMIFFFILQGQFTVLGFVISAKTIARFKDLDDRNFAEYFIVGTMLSVVSAGLIALSVKFFCPF